MHEAALARAAWPDTYHVLRLKLMPYSIGHELLLCRANSPLRDATEASLTALTDEQRIQAVIQAALLCHRDWLDNREEVVNLEEWRETIGCGTKKRGLLRRLLVPLLGGARGGFRQQTPDWSGTAIVLADYIRNGSAEFQAEIPGDFDGKITYRGAPQTLQLYLFIQKHLTRDEIASYGRTAWDVPFGFAKMLWQTHAEDRGGLEIYNQRTLIHDQFVAQGEAEYEAKLKSVPREEKTLCETCGPATVTAGHALEPPICIWKTGLCAHCGNTAPVTAYQVASSPPPEGLGVGASSTLNQPPSTN